MFCRVDVAEAFEHPEATDVGRVFGQARHEGVVVAHEVHVEGRDPARFDKQDVRRGTRREPAFEPGEVAEHLVD